MAQPNIGSLIEINTLGYPRPTPEFKGRYNAQGRPADLLGQAVGLVLLRKRAALERKGHELHKATKELVVDAFLNAAVPPMYTEERNLVKQEVDTVFCRPLVD